MMDTQPNSTTVIPLTKVQLVITYASLVARLVVPFVLAAYDGWSRRQRAIIRHFREKYIPRVILYSRLSFSAITEVVIYPSNQIDPILQLFRLLHFPQIKWFPKKGAAVGFLEPEKSVSCEVLHTPDQIQADIIFIHGLHGSLYNTWKQGMWTYRKKIENVALNHKAITLTVPQCNSDSKNCDLYSTNTYDVSTNTYDVSTNTYDISTNDSDGHDETLENITDIINKIDDEIKENVKCKRMRMDDSTEEPYSPCWPRDWLPQDCPGLRVIALNYTTDPFLWRPVWITKRIRTCMKDRSREMVDHLLKLGVGENPIIWVGHSKGGLFVKQMLVDAQESDDIKYSKFLEQTKGIMFYSVPHRGSALAYINLPLLRQSTELTEVKKDCSEVLELHSKFLQLYNDKLLNAEIFSFVETILTFMFITNVRVVSVDSADLGFGQFHGVNIDHREICKPLSRHCFLYSELTSLIHRQIGL